MGGRGGDGAGDITPADLPALEFEWDPAKSASNKTKHGVDFEEAQAIWRDPDRAVVQSSWSAELRFMTTGLLHGRMFTAITTMRGDAIRIISVRRARRVEAARHGKR
ncbi:MAG: BrnT family toxin [Bifidobacteriaceae bacterium]|jgi:uncharacterized DUF497 family protein|nr:BrnT family toxin [Bifidobacteriaceae bacterium]